MWETWIPSVGLVGLLVLAMWIFSRGELEYQRGYWRGYEDGKCDEAARSEAAELRDRVAELERTNFALSEDSALVANENAELRAALERIQRMVSPDNKGWASDATRLNHAHLIAEYALGLLPHQQGADLRAALAATEGSES